MIRDDDDLSVRDMDYSVEHVPRSAEKANPLR